MSLCGICGSVADAGYFWMPGGGGLMDWLGGWTGWGPIGDVLSVGGISSKMLLESRDS